MPKIPSFLKPAPATLEPIWATSDGLTVRLYLGSVLTVLKKLVSNSVHCVVTSPPYWGLRDYGVEGQLGSEKTPEEFVAKMVEVFREVRRVLRDDGTLWLNLGDTYGPEGLYGIPWMVARALKEDGWILRQDIIWSKPSPMPESVKNRCTKSHEYIFLFAKKSGYFYDAEAISEKTIEGADLGILRSKKAADGQGATSRKSVNIRLDAGIDSRNGNPGMARNKRSGWVVDHERQLLDWMLENAPDKLQEFLKQTVTKSDVWRVSSQGYEGAHFAVYPPKLITPCILAGTSEHGACAKCGAPWKRVTDETPLTRERPNDYVKRTGEDGTGNSCANSVAGVSVKTIGWKQTCVCPTLKTVPCVVLDPFMGSGTTAIVALANGRHAVGIDLSEAYLREQAIPRIQGELLARPAMSHLAGIEREALDVGEDMLLL